MGKNKRVPAIRFKGFTEEWKSKLLNKLADFSKGSGYSKNDLCEAGIPIILYGRLYTQYQTVISCVDTFVRENKGSVVSKGNEVIVPASGETAEDIARASAVIQSDVILGGDLNVIYPNEELNSIFLALTISNGSIWKELSKKAQGKSVVHLRNGDLQEVELNYPELAEQKQIGEFFQNVDSLINANQRKLNKLKNIKKACLEKMFPRKGSTIPEIRFKGFTEQWEEKTLGEICTVTIGEFVIQTKQDPNAPYPVYNGGLSNTGFYKEYNQEGPKVIISARGANAGFVNKHESKYWAGNSCYSIGIINNDSWLFLYYTLKYNEETFRKQQQSANIPSVSKAQVVNMTYLAPQVEEQTQIGNFFKNLDNLIAKNEQQLEKLKNIKKAYLEKMFVNKEDAI